MRRLKKKIRIEYDKARVKRGAGKVTEVSDAYLDTLEEGEPLPDNWRDLPEYAEVARILDEYNQE